MEWEIQYGKIVEFYHILGNNFAEHNLFLSPRNPLAVNLAVIIFSLA